MSSINNFVQSEKSLFENSVRSFLPQCVYIPLNQDKKVVYKSSVNVGDVVSEGQILAVPEEESFFNSTNDAYLHSPFPGKVVEISERRVTGGRCDKTFKIQLDGAFSYLGKKMNRNDWKFFEPSYLLTLFNQKGIVNTFGRPESLSKQIVANRSKKGRILVIRMFDEDPSRMTDSFVAKDCLEKILEALPIISKAMDALGIVIAVPQNSNLHFDDTYLIKIKAKVVAVDTSKYPAGFRENLIRQISKSPELKNTTFAQVNRKSIFIDPQTAVNVFNAVIYGIPVLEQYVHITGNCLKAAAMFKVRIGTTIQSLAQQCGLFKVEPAAIVINGILTGFAVNNMNVSVTKNIKSIHFIPQKELNSKVSTPCIRCGKCRSICPEMLSPDLIFRHVTGGKQIGDEMLKSIDLCSNCSLCNSICPSRLPLSQTIQIYRNMKDEQ